MRKASTVLAAVVLVLAACTPPAPLTTTVGNYEVYEGGVAVARTVGAATFTQLNTSIGWADVESMGADVIATFGDRFDFIVFVLNEDYSETSLGYVGRYWSARNSVTGTGASPYDMSSSFGSSSVLQGVSVLTDRASVRGGPILHELLHQWANLGATPPIPTTVATHWGFSSVGGQLGGWDPATFVSLGSGVYQGFSPGSSYGFYTVANGGNSIPYSPLELYLMGLVPDTDVADITVADNPAWVDDSIGKFSATGLTTYTITDIKGRVGGARTPGPATSQKSFSAIVVMLSAASLTNAQWETLSDDVSWFTTPADDGTAHSYNFWEATGGRATISVPTLLP
jgi:hypothetical protein